MAHEGIVPTAVQRVSSSDRMRHRPLNATVHYAHHVGAILAAIFSSSYDAR